MELSILQNIIIESIDSKANLILSASHQIHDHPELSHQERIASGYI
jgi:metal-dependent amidase/aminoacylase/carboxypeptidase family protein